VILFLVPLITISFYDLYVGIPISQGVSLFIFKTVVL
jgi:hypothetical protein